MDADVAGADRAEHRVGQCVQPDIGVGMSGEAHAVLDSDAAYPEMIAGSKGVHVEALADADIPLPGSEQALGRGKVLRSRDLQIVFAAVDDQRGQARGLGDRGVVGQFAADRGAVGGEDRIEVKALRGLGAPQSSAIDRLPNSSALGALDRVAQRQTRDRRDCLVEAVDDPVDQLPIGKGPRPIMDQDMVGAIGRQCFEPESNRILTGRATGDRRKHSQTGHRLVEQPPVFGPDHNRDICDPRVPGERSDCMAQDIGAAERQILLRQPAAKSTALTRRYYERVNRRHP